MLHPRFARQAVCTCDAPVECGVSWTSAISPNATPLTVHFSQTCDFGGNIKSIPKVLNFFESGMQLPRVPRHLVMRQMPLVMLQVKVWKMA